MSSPVDHTSSPSDHTSSPSDHMSSPAGYTSSPADDTSSPVGYTSSPAGCTSSPACYRRSSPDGHRSSAFGRTSSAVRSTGAYLGHTDSAFGYKGATAGHLDSAAGFVGAAAAGSAARYREPQLSPCRTDQVFTLVVEREVDKADPEEVLSLLQGAELKEHVEDDVTNSLKIKVSEYFVLTASKFCRFIIYYFLLFLQSLERICVGNAPRSRVSDPH